MLPETSVEKALQNFGLTKKETQLYIFLAKHELQKGSEIASKTRTAKAVVYRILKILQRKGFIESTLESPVRFKAVPFENILNSEIKARHEEANEIENTKDTLLSDWDKISKCEPALQIEKFVTIEGNQRIYRKIYNMVKATKHELSIITTVQGIMRSDRFGVINEIINHPLRKSIKVRFLTDITEADTKAIQFLKKKLKTSADLRGRNTEFGLKPFPRMVIKDQQEILFFITPKNVSADSEFNDTCLCTNCKSLITAFSGVFEDLWSKSSDIADKVDEIVSGRSPHVTQLLKDPVLREKTYIEALDSAKDEIIIVTSQSGLAKLAVKDSTMEEWTRKGIKVKMMAPVTTDNLWAMEKLLNWCEVKHFPSSYFDTTIIDNCHLFQFNDSSLENTFYTNQFDYIQKTKRILANIWETSHTPSVESLRLIASSKSTPFEFANDSSYLERKTNFMQEVQQKRVDKISERDVLAKIAQEKKKTIRRAENWSQTVRYFGSRAFASIHPPSSFGLPDMIIVIFHISEESSFGSENFIAVNLLQDNEKETSYKTVAFVQDSLDHLSFRKKIFAGSSAESNIMGFKKGELQVRAHGNTLLASWIKPIPLGPSGYVLPPCCLLFEGYGEVKPGMSVNVVPSGRRQELWYNSFDAFVSLFHPKSRYVGSGVEGFVEKDSLFISRPPKATPVRSKNL